MTLSLFSGGLLAAGFAYAYARRVHAHQLAADSARRSLGDARQRSQAWAEVFDPPASEEMADIEIELLDIDDALSEEEEAYDAISPDDLGALWLARATQTSGVRTSPGVEEDGFDDLDAVDPAGRPTEPPEPALDSSGKRSKRLS